MTRREQYHSNNAGRAQRDGHWLCNPVDRVRVPGPGHDLSESNILPALAALGLPPGSGSKLSERQLTTITAQFGSLGSGNHFVEVCLDERDRVWIVLHSGSRGIGNQLATAHIKAARLVAQDEGQVLEDRDLAWLAEGRPEFDAYVADMLWAQRYAWGNREQMMDAALAALRVVAPHAVEIERINCHHNYAVKETHGGEAVWITRKGAIRAGRSDMGVIPGSMGASSFVVRGKDNEASYQSSSHGAGRRLGRKAAIRQLTTESLRTAMAGRAWDDTLAEQLVDDVALAQGWLTGADMPRMADPVVTNTRLICHALPPGVPFNGLVGVLQVWMERGVLYDELVAWPREARRHRTDGVEHHHRAHRLGLNAPLVPATLKLQFDAGLPLRAAFPHLQRGTDRS
jgi:hypothetical protein